MFSARVSLVAICLLQLAAPASVLSIDDAEMIARALDINADAIFPPHQVQKRGLLGGVLTDVGGLVDTLLGGGATTTTTATTAAAAPATTSSANNNNNGGNTAAATTTTTANGSGNGSGNGNGNGSGSSSTNANGNGNSGTTTTANNQGGNNSNNNGNQANTGPAAATGSTSAAAGGNSANGGSGTASNAIGTSTGVFSFVTDEYGHTIAASAPVTFEYLTTLPNGVVSTVTDVVTPTVGPRPTSTPNLRASSSKTAAIAGSIVALFLVIFTVSLLLLLRNKRRRASQLSKSRPDSSMSFGSSDLLHNSRRDSEAPLAPADSATSFRTAPTNINSEKIEFPLPPVPSAGANPAEMASGSHRPVSMGSDATFDLAERRSRTSIIADRNFYRKIGQYPAAGTYTPFAFPPSSDLGHSEDAFGTGRISPTELAAALERTTNPKDFQGVYKNGNNLDESLPISENPFRDSVYVMQPAPPAAAVIASDVANPNARQSNLWRKETFGPSRQFNRQETHPPSSFSEPHNDPLGRKSSLNSVGRGTVRSQDMSEYDTATETHSQHTSGSGRYSYHSAFARYVGEEGDENPFADTNANQSRPSSSRLLTSPSGRRPTTAMSSGSNFDRDMPNTPDPRELFYHPPSNGQSSRPGTGSKQAPNALKPWNAIPERASEESRSDGEKTIRQTTITYPSLSLKVVQRIQGRV